MHCSLGGPFLCRIYWFSSGCLLFLAPPGYGFVVLAAPPPCAAFLVFVASVRYICCFPSISYVFTLRLRDVFLVFHILFGSLKYLTKRYKKNISILYYILRGIQWLHHLDWCCFSFSCHCCGFAGWECTLGCGEGTSMRIPSPPSDPTALSFASFGSAS